MATHHARSVLAALTMGAALAVTGCTAGSATSADTPASAERSAAPDPDPTSSAAEDTTAKHAEDSTSSDKSAADKARPPWCATGALSVSLRPGQPAAGNRYATLVLTNSSGTACRTQGWAGLQLTGKGGKQIPTEVVRDSSTPSRPLTLEPGARASARMHWTVVPSEGDPSDGDCPDPTAMRVIPPDERKAKSAGWDLGSVCGAGEIDLRPLRMSSGN